MCRKSPQSIASKRQRLNMMMPSPEMEGGAMHGPPVVTLRARQSSGYPARHPQFQHRQMPSANYPAAPQVPTTRREPRLAPTQAYASACAYLKHVVCLESYYSQFEKPALCTAGTDAGYPADAQNLDAQNLEIAELRQGLAQALSRVCPPFLLPGFDLLYSMKLLCYPCKHAAALVILFVLLKGDRAEHEAASLVRGWRGVTMALEQHTSSGLSITNALFRVAERMGSAQQRQLLEPHAARELSVLQSDMRHCANGLMEALLRIRHLYRQVLLAPAVKVWVTGQVSMQSARLERPCPMPTSDAEQSHVGGSWASRPSSRAIVLNPNKAASCRSLTLMYPCML